MEMVGASPVVAWALAEAAKEMKGFWREIRRSSRTAVIFSQSLLLSHPRKRKHFGWGREGGGLTGEEEAFVMARAAERFGTALKENAIHAAALSWADGDAAGANADGGVTPTISIIPVVAVPPDLNVDALGHLEVLGLGRSSRWGSYQQHDCGRRQDESNPHHRTTLFCAPQSPPTVIVDKEDYRQRIVGQWVSLSASNSERIKPK
jgi:hypothetical protein